MADVTVKKVEEFDAAHGFFVRARAGLGVTSFGMQIENFPPNFDQYPEHDHADDGQEEVYTLLSGSATLTAGGETFELEPGVFARVGPAVKRRFAIGPDGAQVLAIGGVPGASYEAPSYTEEGADLPV